MEKRKKAVLITCFFAFLFLGVASISQRGRLPDRIAINTAGQPSVGTGDVELVVFEDLACRNCRVFTEEIVPRISSAYVETGKARLTVIPVAFGEDSKPLANAALGVYRIDPDRFIPFVLELLHSKARGREGILNAAAKVGGIDLIKLSFCIDQRLYYEEIDQNLSWAKRLMGDEFGTPTLFVNGIMTSTESFDEVEERIQQIQRKK